MIDYLLQGENPEEGDEVVFGESLGSSRIGIECRSESEAESAPDGGHVGGLELHGGMRAVKGAPKQPHRNVHTQKKNTHHQPHSSTIRIFWKKNPNPKSEVQK